MSLEKVNRNTIELNENVSFFRGMIQGFSEINMVYMSKKFGRLAYMGRTGNGGTFVTNSLFKGITYARDYDFKISNSEIPDPFTRYVTLLEIYGRPYLDRLFMDPALGEGYVIAGPIDLQDVRVLFGADRNNLTIELESRVLPSERGNMQDGYLSRRDELMSVAGQPTEKTLSRSYRANPELTVKEAYQSFANLSSKVHPHFSTEDVAKVIPRVVSLFG